MDPNVTLAQIRRLIGIYDDATSAEVEAIADELVNLVDALDDWLIRGGFLPNDWTPIGGNLLDRAGSVTL